MEASILSLKILFVEAKLPFCIRVQDFFFIMKIEEHYCLVVVGLAEMVIIMTKKGEVKL